MLDAELQRESAARSAFALWPVGIGFGAVLAMRLAVPETVAWSVALAAALIWAFWMRAGWRAFALMLLSAAMIGQGLALRQIARTQTVIMSGDATTRITGRVLQRETDERGRQRYLLDVLSTERPQLSRPPQRARIWVAARHDPIPIAGTFSGLVRLRPPPGPAYPGAYDFAFTPFFDGLGAYGFALGAPTRGPNVEPTLSDRIASLRLSMGERIRAALPGATGAVASALITGERAGVPEDIEEDLRTTSLAHILSISGFHMALVAGFVMLALRSVLAAVPAIALRVATRKLAALGALAATAFYFALSGDNAATERSFIMITLMLGAILIDRPALTLRNVAVAAVLVMAISPHAVLTATFQMSFAATAALVGAFGAYTRWRSARDGALAVERSPTRVLVLALTAAALSSLIAGAATAPYGVYHFHRVAPFGLVANLIATPLFTFWIMPLSLVSALAMPFALEHWPLQLVGWGLDLTFRIAHHLALWLPDQSTGRITAMSVVFFTFAILVLSFSASRLRWLALPLAAVALLTTAPPQPPEMLLHEDGRETAIRTANGTFVALSGKPKGFVADQWMRAFATDDAPASPDPIRCENDVCRAQTAAAIRVAWTDRWERLEDVCRDTDIAIVARAVRQTQCPDGTFLATLRTLRISGSLAVTRQDGRLVVTQSVDPASEIWNRHRIAAWPERWHRPPAAPNRPSDARPTAAPSGSVGSDPPADPAP